MTINHKALLSATGNVLAQMGKVEGKLTGLVRLRLPAGDVDFPVEFPVLLKMSLPGFAVAMMANQPNPIHP